MNRWNLAWLLAIPAVTVFGLGLAYTVPVSREHEQDYELIKLVAEVLTQVDHNYVRELDPAARRRLVEDMISGGLERLDAHSTFFTEREFKTFERKSRGEFGGVGIQVITDRGGLFVTSPIVGTPAYEAGIQAGDLILKVDGVSLEHKRNNESVELILGEPGTQVTLTVQHEGDTQPTDITITRGRIEVPTVLGDLRKADDPKEWEYLVDKKERIGYIRLVEFDKPSAAELNRALEKLRKQDMRALVFDLRGNPGGLLTGAVEISDLFLPEGPIVVTRGRHAEKGHVAKTEGGPLESVADLPMVVLIDRQSASAAEIVAAALQDRGRAVVVGERSYGKGSVQNVIETEDGKSALKLTMASYWRPSGKNIHRFPDAKDSDEWGVKPNPGFEVTLTDEERRNWIVGRRSRDIVPGKSGSLPERLRPKTDGPYTDKALEKGLEYLRHTLADAKPRAE